MNTSRLNDLYASMTFRYLTKPFPIVGVEILKLNLGFILRDTCNRKYSLFDSIIFESMISSVRNGRRDVEIRLLNGSFYTGVRHFLALSRGVSGKGKGVWAIGLSRMIYGHHQRTLSASSR